MRISTAAVAEKDNTFFVAKRKPGGALSNKWEFPGGKVDPGETPTQALKREIQEEMNIDIRVGRELCRGSFRHKGKEFQLRAYSVELLSEDIRLDEHTQWKWATLEEIKNMDFAPSDQIVIDTLKAQNP
ncbi:MAG: (deoxy)nucleoside triphosphate pyrophosphohydrolase [Spirochaetia bacterium]